MEYGGFEGIIPAGQYGGGTVMIWDQGSWSPQPESEDVDQALARGSLKFVLNGNKLRGKWALVRMGGRAAGEKKPNWLLIKEHDAFEREGFDAAAMEAERPTAVTGRSLEQIAALQDHVWNSRESAGGKAWYRSGPRSQAGSSPGDASAPPRPEAQTRPRAAGRSRVKAGGREDSRPGPSPPGDSAREKLPAFVPPELASMAAEPPAAAGWVHELKLLGYRIQARKQGERVQLLTRKGLDWTARMKTIAAQVAALPARDALLDGEVVVLTEKGTTSFADLQAAFEEGARLPLTYFAFDLLHLDGRNLRPLPLLERKQLLAGLLSGAGEFLRLSEHLAGSGGRLFQKACELHAEGIVSKRAASPYLSGRSPDWLKLKCVHEQEFVVGGFTLPSKGGEGIGALLLGYYRDGSLVYAGRTGTGFTQKTHRLLRRRLEGLRRATSPFGDLPRAARKGALWVKPEMVVEVTFSNWTADDLVRQAAFAGVREDKPAGEVVREDEAPRERRARHARVAAGGAPAALRSSSSRAAAVPTAGRAPVAITHPGKVLDPESGLTKQQLADYYWAIAPRMLPHIAGRPLSLVRCPDGVGHPCFFQKHSNPTLPAGVASVEVPDRKTGRPEPYITLSTAAALAALAQLGALEIHPWGSRNRSLEKPDRIIFDLDPDEAIPWKTLAASAAEVRDALKDLGLVSFLKTTGGKGLHVVVPIEARHEWPAVKEFAHAFALALEQRRPELYLTKMTKAARRNKIFLDYLRNERGATAVAPYSPRARPGMGVSMPLRWTALRLEEYPRYAVAEFADWNRKAGEDPWAEMPALRQRLALGRR
jgi:bifunctional non-homologous end joining protein LigD